ncbi:MAG: MFS transporter [Firmicutes bacterium]|nr:MFS transporter [Bacillota bacterium]
MTDESNISEITQDINIMQKYKLTIVACLFSVMTFVVAINLVPILFVPLMNLYGLPFSNLGLLIAISFVTQMAVMLLCSKLPDKIGLRPVLLTTSALTVIGFLFFFLVPYVFAESIILAGLIIAVIIYGCGAGFLGAMLNPMINALPLKNKERSLTLFHTSYAGLMVLAIIGTTLSIFFLPYKNWNFVPLIWIIIPVSAFLLWIKAPIITPKTSGEERRKKKEERNRHCEDLCDEAIPCEESKGQINNDKPKSKNKGILIILLCAMTAALASEAIIAKGASSYIEVGLNVTKLVGDILGPAMFALSLAIGRLVYGLWGKKNNMRALMIGGSFVCFVFYLVAALTPSAGVGVAALALSGFAVSLLVPGIMVETGERYKTGGVRIFVMISMAGKIGAAGGPALFGMFGGILDNTAWAGFAYDLGLTTQALALRITLLICAIFPLLSMILQIMLKRNAKTNTQENKNLT